MWVCKRCKTKNNNNNKNCHGPGCKGTKQTTMKKPKQDTVNIQPKKVERIYDYCNVCKKDVVLTATTYKGKKVYRCTNAVHRLQRVVGKTKPFPPGLLEELEAKDSDQTL